jgi:hypothetical protein
MNPPAQTAPARRDAVVYLPGIGTEVPQSIDDISRMIATALDRNQTVADWEYAVAATSDETYGTKGELRARMCTIVRSRASTANSKSPEPMYDIATFVDGCVYLHGNPGAHDVLGKRRRPTDQLFRRLCEARLPG